MSEQRPGEGTTYDLSPEEQALLGELRELGKAVDPVPPAASDLVRSFLELPHEGGCIEVLDSEPTPE